MVRAIDVVRIALEAFGPPIYVRKEIVHNSFVVEELRGKGAIFVDSEDEVPERRAHHLQRARSFAGSARTQREAWAAGD